MLTSVLLLWMAAFPLMGSPGPATISLSAVGVSYGFRRGISYLSGIVLGTIGVLLLIATGITTLLLAQPSIVNALSIIALLYIVYLAWKIATAPVGIMKQTSKQAPSFMSGAVLAIANPKAFTAIGAVYSGHTLVNDHLLSDSIGKILALSLVIVIVNSAWLGFGSIFSTALNNPKVGRTLNIVFALMLLASVVFALTKGAL